MTEMESKKDVEPSRYESGMGECLVALEVERQYLATKADVREIKESLNRFATKEDLAKVKDELGKRISDSEQGLRKEISGVENRLGKEISGVMTELKDLENRLLRGMIRAVAVAITAGVGAAALIVKFL